MMDALKKFILRGTVVSKKEIQRGAYTVLEVEFPIDCDNKNYTLGTPQKTYIAVYCRGITPCAGAIKVGDEIRIDGRPRMIRIKDSAGRLHSSIQIYADLVEAVRQRA